MPYYHVVFTLPAAIADIAYQNKAVIYNLLFKASAETMLTIAADPKHLGARTGIASVLHRTADQPKQELRSLTNGLRPQGGSPGLTAHSGLLNRRHHDWSGGLAS